MKTNNPLHRLIAPLLLAAACASSPLAAQEFVEGRDYERVEPAQNTATGERIEVREIFWYGCPHCFDFEPYIERWLQDAPEDVQFVRMPAVFRQSWAIHARAFYAAKALGVLEDVHSELFSAIHVERRKLVNQESIAAFFAEQGAADEETFNSAYESFAVEGKVKQAATLSRRYGITGVPAMIVNGKYRSSGRMAGGYDRLLKIVDHLVAMEREGRSAGD